MGFNSGFKGLTCSPYLQAELSVGKG